MNLLNRAMTLTIAGLVLLVAQSPREALAELLPYQVTDLGILPGGTNSRARGLNDAGQVTGFSSVPGITSQAILFDENGLKDLGTSAGVSSSFGQSINNLGQITGNANFGSGSQLFLWTPEDGMVNIGLLPGALPTGTSFGNGINDSGRIVGTSRSGLDGNPFRAFSYDIATQAWTDLGTFEGSAANAASSASAISNTGWIAGNAANANNARNAFRYDPTTGTLKNLGTLGGNTSFGNGVNDLGFVVGHSSKSSGPEEAFLYDPTTDTMTGLGSLGGISRALDINNQNNVVGWSNLSDGSRSAFIHAGGEMIDLNALLASSGAGWELLEAYGINDAGQIVGEGRFGGQIRGFLLTPVPEPSSWLLGGLGAFALACYQRQRRNRKQDA